MTADTSTKTYTIDKSKPVLATGAMGDVAGVVLQELPGEGVTVHATVRDASKKNIFQYLQDVGRDVRSSFILSMEIIVGYCDFEHGASRQRIARDGYGSLPELRTRNEKDSTIGSQNFTPGAYRYGTRINNAHGTIVTLDGQGNPDTTFLFMAGTITAAGLPLQTPKSS
jgi:hypothetical protein